MSQRMLLVAFLMALTSVATRQSWAVDVFYDFEDGNGRVAIDKLTDDGAQNGTFFNNVSFDSSSAPFGSQAALFEEPDPPDEAPPFSTLEINDTMLDFDFSLTVAMHMENKEAVPDFTRLFSTFQGTGPPQFDRSVFLDFDPTEASGVTGIRALVNGTAVMTPFAPDGLSDPGYHHYAMTIDQGDVTIYFDGEEVVNGNVGLGYTSDAVNIHIGEDPHDGGGTADEQLIGNFDEVLVLGRALEAREIALLADGNLVSSVITPAANELAVYYDFEGDRGTTITDKFTGDAAQNGTAHLKVGVDTDANNAKLGTRSASIEHPAAESSIFSQIDMGAVGNLGDQFTLSAVVNVEGGGFPFDGLTRLFSSFRGTGPIEPEELIFDFDPNASVQEIGMRLVLPDGTQLRSDVTFTTDENHTLTAVYDQGEIRLYLDGEEVDSGDAITADEVDLGLTPLKIGEDNGGILNENFLGIMDDVVVLSRALSGTEVAALAEVGAAEFLGVGRIPGDFDNSGQLDIVDINMLVWESASMENKPAFDLNSDAQVNGDDVVIWVKDLKLTWLGDANLDGEFGSSDLVEVFQAGKYEQDVDANWAEGDWTGDHRFGSSDLVAAFQDGGYELGQRAEMQAVPEPTASTVLLLVWFTWTFRRRR